MTLEPPPPLHPDMPRWAPQAPFPRYAHRPGKTPHPDRDPRGHSYGKTPLAYETATDWQENLAYLYGVDCYHYGYFWEAHESWEGLWRSAAPNTAERAFLQGLILLAAAMLKARMGNPRGAATRSKLARRRLDEVLESGHATMMGLDVAALRDALSRHFCPMWREPAPPSVRLTGPPPLLALNLQPPA